MRKTALLALLCAVACKKDGGAGDGTAPPRASGEAADALWGFAPDKLAGGLVITGDALALADPILDEARLLAKDAELGVLAQLVGQLDALVGKPDQHLADVGIDPKRGFAFFQTDDKQLYALMPMGDRDKFVKTMRGTRGARPEDDDTIRALHCNVIQGAYICAEDLKVIGPRVGKGPGAKVIGAKIQAAGARGDVELYLANSLVKPSGYTELVASATLGKGAVDGRVFLAGKSTAAPLVALASAARSKPELANPAGFLVGDLAPITSAIIPSLPGIPLPGGAKPAELIGAFAGPIKLRFAAGTNDFDVRIALEDPAPWTATIAHCADLGMFLTLADKQEPGACALAVKVGYPNIVAWVEGNELRLGTRKGAPTPGATDVMTPTAKDLATGDWSYAMWGRGTLFGSNKLALPDAQQLPPEAPLILRGMGLVDELAAGVKVDADGIRGRVYARTVWSNPTATARALAAIPASKVLDGTAPALAKAIADGAKDAPFAQDFASGQSGLMAPVAAIGLFAGVAIPAFVDYQKGPRKSLAELQLNLIGKHAKVYYVQHGAYPKGTVAPGPTCCGQPDHACHDKLEDPLWKELEVELPPDHQMYRFGYTSTDGKSFTATATGDLDCDGTEVTWTLTGTANADMPETAIVPPATAD